MPISLDEEIRILATELSKLVKFGQEINLPRKDIMWLVPRLSKLELMILDGAIKEFDLVRLRDTLLILKENYAVMLYNVTQCFLLILQRYLSR